MKNIFLFILICMLSLNASLEAQVFSDPIFERDAQQAISHVYNLQFEKADREIKLLSKRYPDHPAPEFLFAVNRWWQTYISVTTPKYYDYIETKLELALEKNEKYEDNPDFVLEYTYLEFMTYALKARFNSYLGNWWKAANSARKVLGYLKDGFNYTDQRPEFYFSSGIYHYYAETYPDQHPVAKPFMAFFPDGDAAKGLKELELAGAKQNFAQAEALFYLADIFMYEKKDYPRGVEFTKNLADSYPLNTWFVADYGQALVLNGQYEKAQKVLSAISTKYESQPGHATKNITSLGSRHTSHMMMKSYNFEGQVKLFGDKNYSAALSLFEKSQKMAKLTGIDDHHYLSMDWYHIGRCYDGLGEREKAITAYKNALKMEDNAYIKMDAKACLERACID